MEMFLDEIPDRADGEHDIDERGNQRQQNLENKNVGKRYESQRPLARENSPMLVHRLQNAERPAKSLAHQSVGIGRRFSEGERHVFVFDAIAEAKQGHGEVGVFRDGIDVIASGLAHGGNAPRADGSGYDADCAENVEGAAFEVLAGDVFESLPTGPKIYAVANFGIAGHCADSWFDKMGNKARVCAGSDD